MFLGQMSLGTMAHEYPRLSKNYNEYRHMTWFCFQNGLVKGTLMQIWKSPYMF